MQEGKKKTNSNTPASSPSTKVISVPPGFESESLGAALTFEGFDTKKAIPLAHSWCFWHDKFIGGQTAEEYEASLIMLCSFNTVQEFWRCFNNLPPVDQLKPKSSFHMMKEGVKPIWEDPNNAEGGFWAWRIKKENTASTWKEIVLAIIGEQLEDSIGKEDEIMGLTVSIRQYDNVLRIWNKRAEKRTESLLTRLKELTGSEIRNPFYKANKEHEDYDKSFNKKQ